ncbi:MAG TPA: metalloregulator ArsR/SmtB family transcription factor [Vineibacter sp.]|nr:metalloregulator ArsR/SmtB family transcription factor [Vineibacter sp.]
MARPHKPTTETGDVFQALADPNRRQLLAYLAAGERGVQDVASYFPISIAAVSQHLQILHTAGLVRRREAGRRRLYSVDPDGLGAVRTWIDGLTRFWETAVDRLEAHLDDDAPNGGQ